jgi:hypothetical protein
MKQQLITPIRILLPSRKLIIHRQRNAFFESVTVVSTQTDFVSKTLQTQSHVEIFRDVGFGPEFLIVFVFVRDLLDCGPAENGIVSDEGTYVASGDGEADCGVDEICEEGDSVLRVVSSSF